MMEQHVSSDRQLRALCNMQCLGAFMPNWPLTDWTALVAWAVCMQAALQCQADRQCYAQAHGSHRHCESVSVKGPRPYTRHKTRAMSIGLPGVQAMPCHALHMVTRCMLCMPVKACPVSSVLCTCACSSCCLVPGLCRACMHILAACKRVARSSATVTRGRSWYAKDGRHA